MKAVFAKIVAFRTKFKPVFIKATGHLFVIVSSFFVLIYDFVCYFICISNNVYERSLNELQGTTYNRQLSLGGAFYCKLLK
jgi:hypothetical protein